MFNIIPQSHRHIYEQRSSVCIRCLCDPRLSPNVTIWFTSNEQIIGKKKYVMAVLAVSDKANNILMECFGFIN